MKIVTYAEYGEDDTEPDTVVSVTDLEGDIWYPLGDGQWHHPPTGTIESWTALVHGFGPLRVEVPSGRHDSDCQAFQHTYAASQGEPGIYQHSQGMVDAVGTNGRRLLIRDDADGIYVGGGVFTNSQALKIAAHLDLMVTRRGGPR